VILAGLALLSACSRSPSGPAAATPIPTCAPILVAGYPDAGIFYVRDYTPMPVVQGPPQCFSSVREALGAGLKPAPPPPGGILLDEGIYLLPPDALLHAACVRAAAVVHFPVPCPGLIPMHRAAVSCPTQDYGTNTGGTDCVENSGAGLPGGTLDTFTFAQSDMVLPETYVGIASGTNHIFIIGVRADSRLAAFRASCGTPVAEVAGPAVFGHPSSWLECPAGGSMHSGHTLLRWSGGPVVYAISLHGYGARNRQIAQTLADAVDLVSPP
jgi:hypothetical protein